MGKRSSEDPSIGGPTTSKGGSHETKGCRTLRRDGGRRVAEPHDAVRGAWKRKERDAGRRGEAWEAQERSELTDTTRHRCVEAAKTR